MAYVRQQAWLNTIPDKPEKNDKAKKAFTHQELLEKRYGEAEWLNEIIDEPVLPPEIGLWYTSFRGFEDEPNLPYELAHIWCYLLEVGPVNSNGMGQIPISFSEIKDWMIVTGTFLSSWEVLLLRKCSQVWISAQYEAKKPDSIPPWEKNTLAYNKNYINDRRKYIAQQLSRL